MTRQESIHEMGFDMNDNSKTEYGKIKVGVKTLEDAILDIGWYNKYRRYNRSAQWARRDVVVRALASEDVEEMREISRWFYKNSGIYQKVVNYAATMFRYDWYVSPEIYDDSYFEEEKKEDKVRQEFSKLLNYLDNSYIKRVCGQIALNVIRDGVYYGIMIEGKEGIIFQELPARYCRSRFMVNNLPAIEFNMRYFDDVFHNVGYRMKVLKMFPKDIQRGYSLYKQGKLPSEEWLDGYGSWYLLETGSAIKLSLGGNGNELPLFINAIPSIIDLDAAQDLDYRKQMQDLLTIIIQKLPRDKNGDLIFDVDEARDIHNNAVSMLKHAVGVDVLTTFADIDSIDLSDSTVSSTADNLQKSERTVYNNLGVAQNLFNAEGQLSIEKSILNDEGSLRDLVLQFEIIFDTIVQRRSPKKNKYKFRFYMLMTTQYNYKELADKYKAQVQTGYSKILPQIALGHSQSSIINTAYFENFVLHLSSVMVPPMMSSTLSSEDIANLGKINKSEGLGSSKEVAGENGSESQVGRPSLPEDQLSEKSIANRESEG